MREKTVGAFIIGNNGWLFVKCKAGSHDLEIRFEAEDLPDLKHAIKELIRAYGVQKK